MQAPAWPVASRCVGRSLSEQSCMAQSHRALCYSPPPATPPPTPRRLLCCVEGGLLESAELLLERGANAAAVNAHGLSALMFASHLKAGAAAMVRLLLRHGAGAVVNAQVGPQGGGLVMRKAAEGTALQKGRERSGHAAARACWVYAFSRWCAVLAVRAPVLLYPFTPAPQLAPPSSLCYRTPVDAPPCTMRPATAMWSAWRRCWKLALTHAYPTCVLPTEVFCACANLGHRTPPCCMPFGVVCIVCSALCSALT